MASSSEPQSGQGVVVGTRRSPYKPSRVCSQYTWVVVSLKSFPENSVRRQTPVYSGGTGMLEGITGLSICLGVERC